VTLTPADSPIAVVCALEVERRALADLARPGVEIHVSGIGPDRAAGLAEHLTHRPLRAMIATGFCGAISPSLRAGEVVVADRVVHENTGEEFRADEVLLAAADGRRGTLVTANGIARTPADRAALNGLAVDLESAALARAAAAAGVPFLAVRAVSDGFRDHLPDLTPLVDRFGRPDWRRLALFVLRNPGEIPLLIRLARNTRRAGRALTDALATTLGRLGA
jgi:nucleoside phosphorylase